MAIIAKEPESKFSPAPEGLFQGVCADVVDLGTEVNKFNGGLQDKIRIVWQLEEVNKETGKPYEISQKYTNSLHEKATLRHHLEAWRGKKFTQDELMGFDLEKLIGANCQIQVVHNVKDGGKTYANVQAVVPAAKNAMKIRVTDGYVRSKDRKPTTTNGTGEPHAPADQITDDDVPF